MVCMFVARYGRRFHPSQMATGARRCTITYCSSAVLRARPGETVRRDPPRSLVKPARNMRPFTVLSTSCFPLCLGRVGRVETGELAV